MATCRPDRRVLGVRVPGSRLVPVGVVVVSVPSTIRQILEADNARIAALVDAEVKASYQEGYDEGYDRGFAEGYSAGFEEGEGR